MSRYLSFLRSKLNSIILLSLISIASTSATIVSPILPNIERFYKLDAGHAELSVSIFLLGYMLGQLVYGPLANYLGRMTALRIGLAINVLGVIVMLLAMYFPMYSVFLMGRFIASFGSASGLVCAFILINENFESSHAKKLLSYSIISFTLGIYFGTFLSGLLAFYFHWFSVIYFLLGYSVLTYLITYSIDLNRKLRKIKVESFSFRATIEQFRIALSNKKLVVCSLILALSTIMAYLYAAEAPLIMQNDVFKLSPKTYGIYNMINAVGLIVGSFVSSALFSFFRPRKVLIIGFSVCATGLSLLFILKHILIPNALIFFFSTSILFFSSSIIYPTASHLASNSIDCRANASSIMNFINMSCGFLVVTIFSNFVSSHFNGLVYGILTYLILCILLLSINFRSMESH